MVHDAFYRKLNCSDKMQIGGCLRVEVRSHGDREIAEGHKETWGSDGYVHHLDGDDGFASVYMCQNLSDCTFQACAIHCMPGIPQQSWVINTQNLSPSNYLTTLYLNPYS